MSLWIAYIYMEGDVNKEVCVNIEHVIVDCLYMEGDVNKEVCVNIELFLLVFIHETSPRRAFAAFAARE